MQRIDVVKVSDHWWQARTTQGELVAAARTKVRTVSLTAEWAKAQPHPVSVRIHLANGRIQEERTYPRSADPASSPG